MNRKGQANIVMMVLVLLMVFAVSVFLLQMLKKAPGSELDNMYVHNMLLSIMRTDTGYLEENCKTVSDVIACAFFEPYYKCDNTITCENVARNRLNQLVEDYRKAKENRIYYIEVEPEGKVISYQGKAIEMTAGSRTAEDSSKKTTANEKVQKLFRGEAFTINVRLTMAKME